MTPRLKNLVKLALKEVSRDVRTETRPEEEPTHVDTAEKRQLPMFLWPAEYTPSDVYQTSSEREEGTQAPVGRDGGTVAGDIEHQSIMAHHRDERRLHDILKEIHRQLLNPSGPSSSERLNAVQYRIIEDKTAGQVVLLLKSIHDITQRDPNQTSHDASTSIYENSQRIINTLVPEDCENPMIAKYWGAVYRLLEVRDCEFLQYFSTDISALWTLTYDIQTEVQGDDEADRPRCRIPTALPVAFPYLVMFLVLASSPSCGFATSEKLKCCKTSLIEAKKQLMLMIHTLDYGGRAGLRLSRFTKLP